MDTTLDFVPEEIDTTLPSSPPLSSFSKVSKTDTIIQDTLRPLLTPSRLHSFSYDKGTPPTPGRAHLRIAPVKNPEHRVIQWIRALWNTIKPAPKPSPLHQYTHTKKEETTASTKKTPQTTPNYIETAPPPLPPPLQHQPRIETHSQACIDSTLDTLPPPVLPLFPLYWMVMQLSVRQSYQNAYYTKEEVSLLNRELDDVQKTWSEKVVLSLAHEKNKVRWGQFVQASEYLSAAAVILGGLFLATTTGITLLGGALLLAGGILSATNHILHVTRVWDSIGDHLPFETPQQRKQCILYLQLAWTGLAVGLSIVGGGFSFGATFAKVGPSGMKTMATTFGWKVMQYISGAVGISVGLAKIGEGRATSRFCDDQAVLMRIRASSLQLQAFRKQSLASMEQFVELLGSIFESFSMYLEITAEIFKSQQRAMRGG